MGKLPPSRSWSGDWGSNKPYKSRGNWSGNSKPPRKGGGLCIQVAPWAAWPAIVALAHAIGQSLT